MILPYKSGKCRLTSKYGYRTHPVTGQKNSFHGGIDLVGHTTGAGNGNEIIAVASGRVVRSRIVTDKSNATWQWGEYIAIEGDDGMTIYYCHLAERLVAVGERVTAGQLIGIEGSTGQVTGQHLHFEVRNKVARTDPSKYLGIRNAAGTYTLPSQKPSKFKAGDKYTIKDNDVYFGGRMIPTRLIGKEFTIMQVGDMKILLKEIMSWVAVDTNA